VENVVDCIKCTTDEFLPELSRFNCSGLLINEDGSDVRGSLRVYQCLILLLRRQIVDVAEHSMINKLSRLQTTNGPTFS
jgi:hypothetical protein